MGAVLGRHARRGDLDEGDTLINVVLTQPGDEVVLITRNGMAIRFAESDARSMGRNTRGVKGINLQGDDEVVGLPVPADASAPEQKGL